MALYNRNLLTNFDVDDILDLLNQARDFVQKDSHAISASLKQALLTRIELRVHLLAAVNVDQPFEKRRAQDWESCIGLLSDLKENSKLGKPVHKSFSIKLQRKLASTVPPRSIVDVTFDDAWDFLSRLCTSGRDAYSILDYHGGSWLQVCDNGLSQREPGN